DRRGDPGARAGGRDVRARPGGAGRLGGGLPAPVGALLPVGPAPPPSRPEGVTGRPYGYEPTWLADRNALATSPGCCLSIATALFIAMMAGVVSSALTWLMMFMNCCPPSSLSFLVLMTRAMFWKPKMCLG